METAIGMGRLRAEKMSSTGFCCEVMMRITMRDLVCAATVTAAFTVTIAEAQNRRDPRSRGGFMSTNMMRALDANRDGRISAAEIERATRALQGLDRDRDGELSFEELGITRRPGSAFGRPGGFGGGGSSRSGASRISRSGLVVGSPLPDVTVFDEQGQPFALKQLKGGHTVIVFGCLT